MMDAIDTLLANFSKEIEIIIVPNPKRFVVRFGAFPSQETLSPLLRLFESKRFEWSTYDKEIDPEKTLSFNVDAVNVIPVPEAIAALTKIWTDMGYRVKLKHEGGKEASLERGGALDKA
jgi:hypothetical protein